MTLRGTLKSLISVWDRITIEFAGIAVTLSFTQYFQSIIQKQYKEHCVGRQKLGTYSMQTTLMMFKKWWGISSNTCRSSRNAQLPNREISHQRNEIQLFDRGIRRSWIRSLIKTLKLTAKPCFLKRFSKEMMQKMTPARRFMNCRSQCVDGVHAIEIFQTRWRWGVW